MVFGSGSPRDGIERTRAADLAGIALEGAQPPPSDVMQMLLEARALLADRSIPFHRRAKEALAKADEAAAAFPQSPYVLAFRGSLRFQNLDYHSARLDFESLVEALPGEKSVVPALARISMEIGDFEHAAELIEGLLEDYPGSPNAVSLKAEWFEKREQPGEAAALLMRIIPPPGQPDAGRIRNAIASLLLDADDPERAIDVLRPLIDTPVQDPETHRLYGDALSEIGGTDDALDAYRAALHLDPGNMKAHYNFGVLLREMGYLDRALTELEIVSSSEPNDADTHQQLFEMALQRGDPQAALRHALRYLLNANEIEDDDPAMAFIEDPPVDFGTEESLLYAQYLIENDDAERAASLLAPFTENPDLSPPFEVMMARAMRELDRTGDAIKWTDKALDNYEEDFEGFIVCDHPHPPNEADSGEFAELVCQMAELHLSRGDIDKALEALGELGEDDSLAHTAKRITGEAAYLKGEYEEALEHFHAAVDEYPADVDSLASLGAAYRKLGNADAAINYYLRAHLNDNEDIPIIKNLAELYLESGRSREAKVFLLKYAAIEDDEEGLAWAEGELVKLS